MTESQDEKMKIDFQKQLEKLRAKEAIRGTLNEALYKQKNPIMKDQNIKRLFHGITWARQSREKDLEGM